jgi:hypothetical protein
VKAVQNFEAIVLYWRETYSFAIRGIEGILRERVLKRIFGTKKEKLRTGEQRNLHC